MLPFHNGLHCLPKNMLKICIYDYRSALFLSEKGGAYMSAPVLLNLSNKLGISDEMRDLSSFLSLFPNLFDKFNNTGA